MKRSTRADQLLVTRGLFESRARAQAAIAAGLVTADGAPVRKASQPIPSDAKLIAASVHPYVSRGGVKLAAALAHFGLEPGGKICLDVGSSTGGFADVLVRVGARRIYAVDVGTEQLHSSLREKPEIVPLENTDIRALDRKHISEPIEFVTIDVSFISLKLVLPAVTRFSAGKATLVALIKPQFEAGRANLRKGIVRDPAIHAAVCEDVMAFAATLGWRALGVIESPISGGEGNREFLLAAQLTVPAIS
jgi:23S rRNA (cytidine1920-2'-O)/16S rRNA (cytidine1409-2'-O)-methyltransferase